MSQVITIDYHYSDDEKPNFHDKPFTIGQKQLKNGDFALWDYTNNNEVAWNKNEGIVASIDKYIYETIDIGNL